MSTKSNQKRKFGFDLVGRGRLLLIPQCRWKTPQII